MASASEINLLQLNDDVLEKIFSCLTFHEIAKSREVCKKFDNICQMVLNRGFRRAESYHAKIVRKIKKKLPRRESERRKHPLNKHNEILQAIETRMSLLGMTFKAYISANACCFIPGQVLDELFSVLRHLDSQSPLGKAHEILKELRDLSSMAMEYFDEHIVSRFSHSRPKICVMGLCPTINDNEIVQETIAADVYPSSINRRSSCSCHHMQRNAQTLANIVDQVRHVEGPNIEMILDDLHDDMLVLQREVSEIRNMISANQGMLSRASQKMGAFADIFGVRAEMEEYVQGQKKKGWLNNVTAKWIPCTIPSSKINLESSESVASMKDSHSSNPLPCSSTSAGYRDFHLAFHRKQKSKSSSTVSKSMKKSDDKTSSSDEEASIQDLPSTSRDSASRYCIRSRRNVINTKKRKFTEEDCEISAQGSSTTKSLLLQPNNEEIVNISSEDNNVIVIRQRKKKCSNAYCEKRHNSTLRKRRQMDESSQFRAQISKAIHNDRLFYELIDKNDRNIFENRF